MKANSDKHKKISVVLTIHGNDGNLLDQIDSLLNQSLTPDEIIIINSEIEIDIGKVHIRIRKNIKIRYFFSNERLFPGASRNQGLLEARNEIVAFLDSKTYPLNNWLESSLKVLNDEKSDLVFGKTQYLAKSFFQEVLLISMYGKRHISTIPGTLIYKNSFKKIGNFLENVRAGEDLEWRSRILQNNRINYSESLTKNLIYKHLSKNIFKEMARSFRNSWSAAKIDAQVSTRLLIFFLVFNFLIVITPNWNKYLGGYLFIPNITKIAGLTSSFLLVFFYLRYGNLMLSMLKKFLATILLIICLTAYFVPRLYSDYYNEELVNLPLIYLMIIILFGFIFRGFITPIRLGGRLTDILPIKWIFCGFVGLINDISKFPGYLLGALFFIGKRIKLKG